MKRKLKNILFSSYILVSLIPLFVLAFVSLHLLSNHVRKDAHTKNSLLAELISNEISTFIDGKYKSLKVLKEVLNNTDLNDTQKVDRLLKATLDNYSSFEMVLVLDSRGTVTSIAPYDPLFIKFDFSTNSFFTQAQNSHRPYNSQAFTSPRTNQPTVVITIPFRDGVIAGVINLSSLNNIISRISPGEKSSAAITDAKGMFIAHTDIEKVKQMEMEENFDLFSNRKNYTNSYFWLTYGGSEKLTSVAFVKNLNWSIIIYQDAEEVLATVNGIRHLTFWGIGISLAIVLFIAFRRTNNIVKPISRLVQKTRDVSFGDYTAKLEHGYYDEFDKLIDEFNAMIDNIHYREKHYSSLFYNSRTKMLLLDVQQQRIIDINSKAADFFGVSAEQIKGRPAGEFIYSEIFDHDFDPQSPAKSYMKQISIGGTEKFIDIYVSPIEIQGSSLNYLIIHDVTDRILNERKLDEYKNHLERLVEERTDELKRLNQKLACELDRTKQTEEKLRDQLSYFATVLDTVPIPIFIRDLNKKYLNCNKFFESFIGKSRSNIIGKSLFELIPEPFASRYSIMDDDLLDRRAIQTYEYQFPLATGEIRDVIFNKAALIKADGEVVGVIGSFQDITEHKKLEEEIQKALNSEKELNEMKTRFISTTSHEFRTPLTAILSSDDLLELYGRSWPEEKYLKHTGQIRRSVKYMTELLDDILTISRTESGKIVFNPCSVNLKEVCSDIFESVKVRAGAQHTLEMKYLPGEEFFTLDEKLIRHIISNLLTNAIKYSPGGGRIELKVSQKGERLEFMVSDQGIGIPEEEKKNLMVPFFRANNAGSIPGTGLGLSIVKKSVELHGGKLYFESELNHGSVFFIEILPGGENDEKDTDCR